MLGYLDMPKLTNETICDGWVKPATLLKSTMMELSLFVVALRIYKRGGNKVAPIEVESVFRPSAISAVLVTGVPDLKFGEAIHMLVVPKKLPKLLVNRL